MHDQDDVWISNLLELGDFDFMDTENFLTFKEGPMTDAAEPLHQNDMVTDLKDVPPQLKTLKAHSGHPTPYPASEIISHSADIGKNPTLSPNIGGMSWVGGDVRNVSTNYSPISYFDIFDDSMSQDGEFNQVDKNLGRININSNDDIHRSSHLDTLETPIPAINLPNIPTELKYPAYLNVLEQSINHASHDIFQDHTVGGTNCFSPYQPVTQTNPQDGWFPDTHTGVSMVFGGSEDAHLAKDKFIDPINTTPRSGHADKPLDKINTLWDHQSHNTRGMASQPHPHQNSEHGNLQFLERDFDVAYLLAIEDMLNQETNSSFIPQSNENQMFYKPESRVGPDNSWRNKKDKGPKTPLEAHTALYDHQISSKQKNLIRDLHYNTEDMIIHNKRKKLNIGGGLGMGLAKPLTPNQTFYPNNNGLYGRMDGEVVSSKDLPIPNLYAQTPIYPMERHFNMNIMEWRNNFKAPTQDVPDMMPRKKKTRKRQRPHTETGMYRNQVRSSFDFTIEKYVTPFMIQLQEYLKTDEELCVRYPGVKKCMRMRLTLMTHEFLLLLIKVKFSFDPYGGDLSETLNEGYMWLENIWKTIPFRTIKLEDYAKTTNYARAYPETNSINTIRDSLISRAMSHNLFTISQQHFICHVILSWMKTFRPKWFDLFMKIPGCSPSWYNISDYQPNVSRISTQFLLSYIQEKLGDLEKKAQPITY